jgi:transposase-like protein
MSTVVGAVVVCTKKMPENSEIKSLKRKYKNGNATKNEKTTYAGRLRLQVIPDRCGDTLTEFMKENVASPTTIFSDGWQGYNKFPELGYKHKPLVLNGDPEKAEAHLPVIHRSFSNLKTWLLGTHHGRVEPQHLQAYLNEYVFRFNRRFHPMAGFNAILGLAARTLSPTYEELYSGIWEHPGSCPNIEFR